MRDFEAANDAELPSILDHIVADGAVRARDAADWVDGPDNVKDYRLSKYQESGAAGYATVDALVNRNNANNPRFDIVTVRNRNKGCCWGADPAYLSQLFLALGNIGHHYNQIFCSFCRSALDDPDYRLPA